MTRNGDIPTQELLEEHPLKASITMVREEDQDLSGEDLKQSIQVTIEYVSIHYMFCV